MAPLLHEFTCTAMTSFEILVSGQATTQMQAFWPIYYAQVKKENIYNCNSSNYKTYYIIFGRL
jgi:hypothetical protein